MILLRVRGNVVGHLVTGFWLATLICFALWTSTLHAQATGQLKGKVFDPSGALVPGAVVMLTQDKQTFSVRTDRTGAYRLSPIPVGRYSLTVQAQGFAPFSRTDVPIVMGQTTTVNAALTIAVERQAVTVTGQQSGVSTAPDENGNAIVIKGKDLDALSDDPDELQDQLQALAGPAAGPNGGQIYIDGFTGGQLPPKSSIREIRVNQNPFSAEFDRLGYGRIEILTKPGSDKLHGHFMAGGNDSAFDARNPLVQEQPSYYAYYLQASVNGPISSKASYFVSLFARNTQNQNIVNAVNPDDPATNLNEAISNPLSSVYLNPRVDLQLGSNNTMTLRYTLYRADRTANGVGQLNLPQQAFDVRNEENAIQIGDTQVVNAHLINETRFQWRRIRNNQVASYTAPTITAQGSFVGGGNNSGTVRDHQDIFEFQNYSTAAMGNHTIRFGVRLRAYRDANYSTAGSNGNYIFSSVNQYEAQQPDQYQATVITNPLARALLFDGALFYQDEWRWKPNFTLSYGLRFEGQNRIHDHADWCPRVSIAWAPGSHRKSPAKTVIRAGYGWFYDRFAVPNSFSSLDGTPYIIQAIHENGINQQSYVVSDPTFYDPNAPVPPSILASSSTSLPTLYTVDHHFHAALDMQAALGIDRQISKKITSNVTYLYTRGVHQYFSNNVTAPDFDPTKYVVTGGLPTVYNYQFQSGGVYNEHQLIATVNAKLHRVSLFGSYTFTDAKSDTQGVTYFPSVSTNPGLDYGRAGFDIRHRLLVLGNISAPYAISFAPFVVFDSGVPYNITVGSDLTENNQFNARPTFGVCGAPDVVSTRDGCLDTKPVGKGEQIIPYDAATGPSNFAAYLRVSKVIGVGPRIRSAIAAQNQQNAESVSTRGLSGGQNQPGRLDASAPRKYSLTFVVIGSNIFNHVNLGQPNGVLSSSLFGKSQSLAGGAFTPATAGNRSLFLQTMFNF